MPSSSIIMGEGGKALSLHFLCSMHNFINLCHILPLACFFCEVKSLWLFTNLNHLGCLVLFDLRGPAFFLKAFGWMGISSQPLSWVKSFWRFVLFAWAMTSSRAPRTTWWVRVFLHSCLNLKYFVLTYTVLNWGSFFCSRHKPARL